ncbi:MAG: hypothetical protein EOM23_11490 [Candidatus Moranbacteria bacterium]|nr:hypothetical protein [Candidatus Moranbacteria bacterium]
MLKKMKDYFFPDNSTYCFVVDAYFDDAVLTSNAANIALIFILFAGGYGTKTHNFRPVAKPAMFLATAGVLITAVITAAFFSFITGWPFLKSLLDIFDNVCGYAKSREAGFGRQPYICCCAMFHSASLLYKSFLFLTSPIAYPHTL